MQVQEKNIRGFNLLELLVVIVIISVISAVAYPNFSSWKKEREARGAALKIKNLFTNINSQVQRGLYAYVQVFVENTNDSLTVTSKGMKIATLTSKINNYETEDGGETDDEGEAKLEDSIWYTTPASRCDTTTTDYWDDEGSPKIVITYETEGGGETDDEGEAKLDDEDNPTEIETEVPNEKLEVAQLILGKVTTTFVGTGAVCFSKNARWYSGAGNFVSTDDSEDSETEETNTSANTSVDTILFLCTRNNDFSKCDIDEDTDRPTSDHRNLFRLEWSRFGDVTMEKWVVKNNDWVLQ